MNANIFQLISGLKVRDFFSCRPSPSASSTTPPAPPSPSSRAWTPAPPSRPCARWRSGTSQWHIEVQLGVRKAVVELTAQDEAASLSSLGIEDYSAVLLEGPLTHTVEGVGQGLALVAAQVRRMEEQNSRMEAILLRIAEGVAGMSDGMLGIVAGQRHNERKALIDAAEAGCLALTGEEAKTRGELFIAARSEYQRFLRFTIDPTTPRGDVKLEHQHTAVKTTDEDYVTLRASRPLSKAHHRWSVRVHEVGSRMAIMLGLLPKLSADMVAEMGSGYSINRLGGWTIYQSGINSYVRGPWQCEPLPFAKGDLVLFDYSFSDKTLTITCNGKQVVGRIPNMKYGEELYPAFSLGYTNEKASFEHHP